MIEYTSYILLILSKRKRLQKSAIPCVSSLVTNRSDVIRTRDLYVPNVALYQAEPHSDMYKPLLLLKRKLRICFRRFSTTDEGLEPSQTESESVVLPLHQSALSCLVLVRRNMVIIADSPEKSSPFCNFHQKVF